MEQRQTSGSGAAPHAWLGLLEQALLLLGAQQRQLVKGLLPRLHPHPPPSPSPVTLCSPPAVQGQPKRAAARHLRAGGGGGVGRGADQREPRVLAHKLVAQVSCHALHDPQLAPPHCSTHPLPLRPGLVRLRPPLRRIPRKISCERPLLRLAPRCSRRRLGVCASGGGGGGGWLLSRQRGRW